MNREKLSQTALAINLGDIQITHGGHGKILMTDEGFVRAVFAVGKPLLSSDDLKTRLEITSEEEDEKKKKGEEDEKKKKQILVHMPVIALVRLSFFKRLSTDDTEPLPSNDDIKKQIEINEGMRQLEERGKYYSIRTSIVSDLVSPKEGGIKILQALKKKLKIWINLGVPVL